MAHEIGHALALGHPDAGYPPVWVLASIMRLGNPGYYVPQSPHDINDLAAKY